MARDEMTAYEREMLAETKRHNEAVLAAMQVNAPAAQVEPFEDADPDSQFHAMMKERRGKHLPPLATELKACKSHVTGATFDAMVNHVGIVVELPNYVHPKGVDESVDAGGLVPHGVPIKDRNGQPTNEYKSWKWANFWKTDLQTFVGKKLPKYAQLEFAEKIEAAE
jgi:hypothetical protein